MEREHFSHHHGCGRLDPIIKEMIDYREKTILGTECCQIVFLQCTREEVHT